MIRYDFFIFFTTYTILNLANFYKSYRNRGFFKICSSIFEVWLFLLVTFISIHLFFLDETLSTKMIQWLISILLVLILDHLIIRIFLRLLEKGP